MSYENESAGQTFYSASSRPFGTDRPVFRLALVAMVALLCAIAIWPVQAMAFNQEGGPFETISAAALFAAGLAALVRFPGITRLYIGVVCLLLAERELEAEVYAQGSLPFQLLDGLDTVLDITMVRIALAVIVFGSLIWHGIPNGWRAFKQRAPFLLVFVLAGSAAVVAQLLEEVSGLFAATLSAVMEARLFALEETLEMYFSIGILAAVLIGWPRSSSEEIQNDQQTRRDPDAR